MADYYPDMYVTYLKNLIITVMQDLKKRYMQLAIKVAELIQKLPRTIVNNAYSNQLIRASSSPGTNYRAALRGKSTADFINKLKIVEEELDETMYFLELIQHFNTSVKIETENLLNETSQLLAITVQSIKTVRYKRI